MPKMSISFQPKSLECTSHWIHDKENLYRWQNIYIQCKQPTKQLLVLLFAHFLLLISGATFCSINIQRFLLGYMATKQPTHEKKPWIQWICCVHTSSVPEQSELPTKTTSQLKYTVQSWFQNKLPLAKLLATLMSTKKFLKHTWNSINAYRLIQKEFDIAW